jgi:hypothetical protein
MLRAHRRFIGLCWLFRSPASFVKTYNRNSFRNYLHDLAHHLDTIQAHVVEENQV